MKKSILAICIICSACAKKDYKVPAAQPGTVQIETNVPALTAAQSKDFADFMNSVGRPEAAMDLVMKSPSSKSLMPGDQNAQKIATTLSSQNCTRQANGTPESGTYVVTTTGAGCTLQMNFNLSKVVASNQTTFTIVSAFTLSNPALQALNDVTSANFNLTLSRTKSDSSITTSMTGAGQFVSISRGAVQFKRNSKSQVSIEGGFINTGRNDLTDEFDFASYKVIMQTTTTKVDAKIPATTSYYINGVQTNADAYKALMGGWGMTEQVLENL